MDGAKGGLVLTVNEGEQIIIGDGPNEVIVTAHGFDRGRCRLHFSATKDVPIDRMSVRIKKRRDNAAQSVPPV